MYLWRTTLNNLSFDQEIIDKQTLATTVVGWGASRLETLIESPILLLELLSNTFKNYGEMYLNSTLLNLNN